MLRLCFFVCVCVSVFTVWFRSARGNLCGRQRGRRKKKKVICSTSRTFGISARTQTTSDVCVGGRSVTGRRTSTRGVVHAQLHIMKAAIDSADHNNSQASHSVMEIPHLIETPFFFVALTSSPPIHNLNPLMSLLNIADGSAAYLQEFLFFSPPLSAEGKRTVNHA